ncbi:MAG: hypothetical protein IKG27_02260 [Bacilli bacterium]|nr:hypothetical protein [Bacilli bacterium]
MRRLKRNRFKNQKNILIIAVLGLFSVFTVGYAAFQTNISLTAKGNVSPTATYTVDDLKELVTVTGDGLYTDSDEQGRYVYKGASPNNYLSLNGETWRIMSIESDDTLKIIRENSVGNVLFDPGRASVISGITASNSDVGTRYSSSSSDYCYASSFNLGCNVWGSKDTMADSGGSLLRNTQGGAKIKRSVTDTVTYNLPDDEAYVNVYLNGGTYAGVTVPGWYSTWSNSLSNVVKSYISIHLHNVGLVSNTSGQLTATDIVQEHTYTWWGIVGLMNASDYVRASSNSACTGVYAYANNSSCYNNSSSHNYLMKSTTQWTIAPLSGAIHRPWATNSSNLSFFNASNAYSVRPVLYLYEGVLLKGEGTISKMYQIANTEVFMPIA